MACDRYRRAALIVACLLPGAALALQTGTYRCFSHEMSGKEASCREVAPLRVNGDGSWTDGTSSGSWRVTKGTLALVGGAHGAGRMVGGDRIVFDYTTDGVRHVVTYLCSDGCRETQSGAPPEAAAKPRPAAEPRPPATRVRLELTLLFPAASEALVKAGRAQLVPAERAAAYRDPQSRNPPAGSSAGKITARAADTLNLTFDEVSGGLEYVLFLETEGGRQEVSTFEVPRTPATQTMFVSASLGDEPAAEGTPEEEAPAAEEPDEGEPSTDDGATQG